MTQTLTTTEELKHLASSDNANELTRRLARECLANREAQQVIAAWQHNGEPWRIILDRDIEEVRKNSGSWNPLFTAQPAPAVPTPVNFSENADADMCRKWAWEQVKELVSTDGWTVGDNITYFGFFCWGWDMRRQYNEQRPPAPVVNPEFTGATAVPTFEEWLSTQENKPLGWVRDSMKESYYACRAAMLAALEGGENA